MDKYQEAGCEDGGHQNLAQLVVDSRWELTGSFQLFHCLPELSPFQLGRHQNGRVILKIE